LLKGQAGDALLDKPCEVRRRRRGRDQKRGFLLGENTARRAQTRDNRGLIRGRRVQLTVARMDDGTSP
jgi:hypothetical protein